MGEEPIEPDLRALHERLLAGDPTATAEIAEALLPTLTIQLRKAYATLEDPHFVDAAVDGVLLEYFDQPQKYDPTRQTLAGYLRMAADRDIRNLLRGQQRRSSRAISLEDVADPGASGEYGIAAADDPSPEDLAMIRNSPILTRLLQIVPDTRDQALVRLMLDQVRETGAYAEALGIADWPADRQAQEVKRHKDRLKKLLRRHFDPKELHDHD